MKNNIKKDLRENIAVCEYIAKHQLGTIENIAREFIKCLKRGNKIILFGNGGSAADAQHIAAELIARFEKNRKPLAAISLSTNTSALTAIANDFGYTSVFARQIEAIGKSADIAVGISTSGESKNVIEAIKTARKMKLVSVAFTGSKSGKLAKISDLALIVNSSHTCRIQEMHILIGHIICRIVEAALANEK